MALSLGLILLTFLYSFGKVSGRTCVCAEFIANECDKITNCRFLSTPTIGDTKGSHGICRSLKWYTCHIDPKCTIKYRDPNSDWNLIDDDALPDETDDLDWPWDCNSGDYVEQTINLKAFQSSGLKLRKIDLEQIIENEDTAKEAFIFKPGHKGSHMKLASEIICGILIVGFIFLMSLIVLISKCKEHCDISDEDEMNDPLLTNV